MGSELALLNFSLDFVGLALLIGAVYLASRVTVSVLPLDERFPQCVEQSLPLRGRWLRAAARVLFFPLILAFFLAGAVGLFVVLGNAVVAIGSLIQPYG